MKNLRRREPLETDHRRIESAKDSGHYLPFFLPFDTSTLLAGGVH